MCDLPEYITDDIRKDFFYRVYESYEMEIAHKRSKGFVHQHDDYDSDIDSDRIFYYDRSDDWSYYENDCSMVLDIVIGAFKPVLDSIGRNTSQEDDEDPNELLYCDPNGYEDKRGGWFEWKDGETFEHF